MRILITGARGQLGSAIANLLPEQDVMACDLPLLDVTDLTATRRVVRSSGAELVVHCAAFTDVDGCALDPRQAQLVNAAGTRNVASACADADATMVLISTNEVFDGTNSDPYKEYDQTNPINAYGRSKLAAELHTQRLLERFYIVRTSWMYSERGSNFIHRIKQLADEHQTLSVVTDELGAPTWTQDLALAILKLTKSERYGLYHLVNSGHTSRYDLARMVLDLTGHEDVRIEPISIENYKRASIPPRNGVLANVIGASIGINMRPWDEALREFLSQTSTGTLPL